MEAPDKTVFDDDSSSQTQKIIPITKNALTAILIIIEGKDFGHKFTINKETITIGRSKECDYALHDGKASRKHIQIKTVPTPGGVSYFLSDLNSTNGTFLNGSPLKSDIKLNNGDKVLIGSTLMGFFLKDPVDLQFDTKMMNLAVHDSLTGLYNRIFLNQTLNNEFARASRYNKALSILFLDVDFFKKINDTYGHAIGDNVLKRLSFLISDMVRMQDIGARYGGEEFIVILPETDLKDASIVAQRIRKEMEKQIFNSDDKGDFTVTVSIGIGSYNTEMETKEDLLKMADDNLYKAKENGRNMVIPF